MQAVKHITRAVLAAGRDESELAQHAVTPRPLTRAECGGVARPCPWVGCEFNLYIDVDPETGSLKLNFPSFEPWQMPWSCTLDEAEFGGLTLEQVGERMNVTRERIRQVEVRALLKLAGVMAERAMHPNK